MSPDLVGRNVLVTGASGGIGLEVARTLAHHGVHVIAAARRADPLRRAVDELPGDGHRALPLDVADQDAWTPALVSVDEAGALHGLVTAAGILGPIGLLEDIDPYEMQRTIAVNLLGSMLALKHCLPRLRQSRGRAVTFSGGGATSPLPRYDAYAASKAAVARLTENVAAAYAGEVEVNAVAPGFVATRIHKTTLAAGPEAVGPAYYERTRDELKRGGVPGRTVAELICFLLSDEAAGITGRLLSAPWDPWRDPGFRQRLREEPELGALRRIDSQAFTRLNR